MPSRASVFPLRHIRQKSKFFIYNKLYHLFRSTFANYPTLITLADFWLSRALQCFALCENLFVLITLNIILKAKSLIYRQNGKGFLSRIGLSMAKKIAREDTLLHTLIRGLDRGRGSLHCPTAFSYKPKWLTNVVYNSS